MRSIIPSFFLVCGSFTALLHFLPLVLSFRSLSLRATGGNKARLSAAVTLQEFECDVPLIFVHGMKGTHLSLKDDTTKRRRRAWLEPTALLNFPPKPDGYHQRDLSLPLTYSSECGTIQDHGNLEVDGLVDHIIEAGPIGDFFPFYGHVSQYLADLQETRKRPTRSFLYDWRRSLPEISQDFHTFCENEFPDQPVQILAHSMGGLVAFEPMRKHPEKYSAGATLVGVPFGTGIQYFQDLHRGYYTELGRNRQFTPPSQFSMSSHWSFFPLTQEDLGDTFVDVTNHHHEDASSSASIQFTPDKSAIGDPGTIFQSTVLGDKIVFDFYDVEEWEKNEVGIFDPKYENTLDRSTLDKYKKHMKVQLRQAMEWRLRAMRKATRGCKENMPDLVVCQTNTVPTLNQILRRKNKNSNEATGSKSVSPKWEYDYISGRSVPGDGRIDYDKSFPPTGFEYQEVALDSLHAKQMCWEEDGGSLGTISEEIDQQLQRHFSESFTTGEGEPLLAQLE